MTAESHGPANRVQAASAQPFSLLAVDPKFIRGFYFDIGRSREAALHPADVRQETTPPLSRSRRHRRCKGGGASVARCPPNRWFPLLLPGGVRTALFWCNFRPLSPQLRRNRECFVIVGTCVMGRCGGPIPSESSAFQHTSILFRPRQRSCGPSPRVESVA